MVNTSQRELASINKEEASNITSLDRKAAQERKTAKTKSILEPISQTLHNQLLAKDLTIIELQQQLASLQQLFAQEKKAKEELLQQWRQHKQFIARLPQLKQLFVKQKQFITRLKQLFIQEKKASEALSQQLEGQKQLIAQLEQQLKQEKEASGSINQQFEQQKQQIKELQRTATIGTIHLDKWRYRTYRNG